MRLGDMTFSKILEVCDSHTCSNCPLHVKYPIFITGVLTHMSIVTRSLYLILV